jgi:hypothetical protein
MLVRSVRIGDDRQTQGCGGRTSMSDPVVFSNQFGRTGLDRSGAPQNGAVGIHYP